MRKWWTVARLCCLLLWVIAKRIGRNMRHDGRDIAIALIPIAAELKVVLLCVCLALFMALLVYEAIIEIDK